MGGEGGYPKDGGQGGELNASFSRRVLVTADGSRHDWTDLNLVMKLDVLLFATLDCKGEGRVGYVSSSEDERGCPKGETRRWTDRLATWPRPRCQIPAQQLERHQRDQGGKGYRTLS